MKTLINQNVDILIKLKKELATAKEYEGKTKDKLLEAQRKTRIAEKELNEFQAMIRNGKYDT